MSEGTSRFSKPAWASVLPSDWQTLPIKKVISIPITDGPHETPEFLDEGVVFISAEAIQDGKIDFGRRRGFISDAENRRYSRKYAPETGDIYIVKSGATTGKSAMVGGNTDFNIWSPLAVVRANENMDSRFVLHTIRSQIVQDAIAINWSWGTQQNIGMGALGRIQLPVPDLATQRQIADFLDRETARIDLLIEKKQRLVALLGEQRAAAISSAVTVGLDEDTELVSKSSQYLPRVPARWRVWRLKHLAEIRGGLTLGRQIPDTVEKTLTPYMRVANVQAGWLDLTDVAETLVTKVEKKRYRLKHGDVLMNEGGDNDKLGRGAVWKSEIDTCVHQNHVFAVRPLDTRYSDWISLATNARYARDFFYLHSNQSTNLASISKTNLSRFPIAIPPLEEMKATLDALWRRVGKLDQIRKKTVASIDRLKEYRSALITAAVTGQIDVKTYAKSGTPDRRLDAIQEEMSQC